MAQFTYIAINQAGTSLSGAIEAPDRASASSALSRQGLRPISVKLAAKASRLSLDRFLGGGRVKSDDLVMFTRQLSAMISAGVPLLRAISSLEAHAESPALKKVLGGVISDVESGSALGDALAKHPQAFSDVYVNMVRAGETAGILDDILKRLAFQQEKNASIRKKIKSAMTYPTVLVVITLLAFFGLMFFVIPQIGKILIDLGGEDAKLPAITLLMLGISDFLRSWWYVIIPVLVGGGFILSRYLKTTKGRARFHRIVLKVPLVNKIIKKVAVARFARTFSALMGAGVPVLEGLRVTGRAIGNVVYEEVITEAAEHVKNGKPLSGLIEARPDLFPAILSQMLSVGEETGQTDQVLVKVADFYEEEVDAAIEAISSIIEPVMIVFMGGMVGVIAASVMMPIASLSQNIKE